MGTYDSCLAACRSLLWLQITSFAAIATSVPGRHRPEQCAHTSLPSPGVNRLLLSTLYNLRMGLMCSPVKQLSLYAAVYW